MLYFLRLIKLKEQLSSYHNTPILLFYQAFTVNKVYSTAKVKSSHKCLDGYRTT